MDSGASSKRRHGSWDGPSICMTACGPVNSFLQPSGPPGKFSQPLNGALAKVCSSGTGTVSCHPAAYARLCHLSPPPWWFDRWRRPAKPAEWHGSLATAAAAAQGLGPAVVRACAWQRGQARPRGGGQRGAAREAAPARRLRPAGVWFAVFAGEHTMARCGVGLPAVWLVACCA